MDIYHAEVAFAVLQHSEGFPRFVGTHITVFQTALSSLNASLGPLPGPPAYIHLLKRNSEPSPSIGAFLRCAISKGNQQMS